MWLLCHTDHHRHPLAPPPLTDYGFVCASGCCLVHGMPLTACQSIVLGGVWPHVRRVVRMGCSLPSPDRTAVTHDRPPLPGLSFVLFCVLCLFWEPILCNPIYRVSLALSPVPHALHHLVERPALVLISIAMMARMAGRGARSCGWRCAWVTKLKLCFPSCDIPPPPLPLPTPTTECSVIGHGQRSGGATAPKTSACDQWIRTLASGTAQRSGHGVLKREGVRILSLLCEEVNNTKQTNCARQHSQDQHLGGTQHSPGGIETQPQPPVTHGFLRVEVRRRWRCGVDRFRASTRDYRRGR
jgi:hypothetical protein